MEYRSTNDNGYVHFQGDVVSNVSSVHAASSHGVRLTGGSTGGTVEAAGDETNIALNVRGKGTGNTWLGSTGGAVRINSTSVTVGSASTTFITNMQRFLLQFTIPALSSAGQGAATSTLTHASATTNAIYWLQQRVEYNSTLTNAVEVTARCSTAAELRLLFWNHGADSLSGSTASAHLYQISF